MEAHAATLPTVTALAAGDWPKELAPTRLTAGPRRLTRRVALHAVLGGTLYGAGSNVHAVLVILLAGMLLGTIGWAWITVGRAGRRIEAARELPATAIAGTATAVRLWLRGPATGAVVVRDGLTGLIAPVDTLAPGAIVSGQSWLPRGAVSAGEVHVDLTDRFGLVRRCVIGQVPSACDLLPAVLGVRTGVSDAAVATVAQDGRAIRAVDGPETVGTREYRPGDRPRAVHWRSTARHGQLVVRELADDARPTVRVVICDGLWTRAALDRAAVVASTVAAEASSAGLSAAVGCDGAARQWGPVARRDLALAPPHVGAEARPLAPAPEGAGDVVVVLSPDGERLTARLEAGGHRTDLGWVLADATIEEVSAWLARWSKR